jgi:hypothetical protein
LPGRTSFGTTDNPNEHSFLGELHDPRVDVSIRYENVPVRSESNRIRAIECVVRAVVTRNALLAQCHQHFSVRAKFVDDMVIRIGRPKVSVAVEIGTVCLVEQALVTLRSHEFSFCRKNLEIGCLTHENDDLPLAIGGNP